MTTEPEGPIDLLFISKQVQRVITEQAERRDDMTVLTAMVSRIDGTLRSVLDELRATHGQINRLLDRVRQLEAKP